MVSSVPATALLEYSQWFPVKMYFSVYLMGNVYCETIFSSNVFIRNLFYSRTWATFYAESQRYLIDELDRTQSNDFMLTAELPSAAVQQLAKQNPTHDKANKWLKWKNWLVITHY